MREGLRRSTSASARPDAVRAIHRSLSPRTRAGRATQANATWLFPTSIAISSTAVWPESRGKSSLATYLTVIARRVVVRRMVHERTGPSTNGHDDAAKEPGAEERISSREEVEHLLNQLDGSEAAVVRMYHLEGKTYQEISSVTGMPTNTVGPMLSRARAKLRSVAARNGA